MALGYGEGSIAGVALTSGGVPVQAILDGGENLIVSQVTNTVWALNGNTQAQVFETGITGAQFSIRFPQMPRSVMTAIIAAVEAAMLATGHFTIVYDDGVNILDLECTPGNSRGEDGRGWITQDSGRTHLETAKNVVMRFIAKSAN